MTPAEVARLLDHTLLRADATQQDVDALCRDAVEFGFAAVCINSSWVLHAATVLAGSEIAVCTVVGFPLGASSTGAKVAETQIATGDGAREVDMVIDIGRLKSGDLAAVQRDVEAVVQACREQRALCKVILETALLTTGEKTQACAIAQAAGADYVKTSTGFGPGGATVEDVELMRRVVGQGMGIKASGGIRDLAAVERLVAAGATRIGTSVSVAIMRHALRRMSQGPTDGRTPGRPLGSN